MALSGAQWAAQEFATRNNNDPAKVSEAYLYGSPLFEGVLLLAPGTVVPPLSNTPSQSHIAGGGKISFRLLTNPPAGYVGAIVLFPAMTTGDRVELAIGTTEFRLQVPAAAVLAAATQSAALPQWPRDQPAALPPATAGGVAGPIRPTVRIGTGKNRQLVVYEANPTNPNYGEMVALAPGDAAGIALPTFQVGVARPTAGTTLGEGFYETSTRTGSVWDGAAWVPVTPRAEIEAWDATKSYAINELVTDRGMIWIAKIQTPIGNQPQEPSSIWRLLGSPGLVKITSICHATDGLDSVPKVEGAQALDRSTGQVYTYLNNRWVELLGGYYGATGTQPTTAQQISFNRGDTPTWPAGTTDLQAAIRLIYQQLAASAAVASAPQIGEIKMFASLTIPAGWQLCDGSAIDASKAAAIALLGANVPDMRSQFPRGWDAGHVPLAREAAATGAPSGGNPSATGVSLAVTGTTNATGNHSHDLNRRTGNFSPQVLYSDNRHTTIDNSTIEVVDSGPGIRPNGDHSHTVTGTATGTVTVNTGWDTETRPANVRVVYAIYIG